MKTDSTAANIIAVTGKSNSGKTTLIEKIITRLSGKGYRIGSVKHSHNDFEIDKKGKDSWRHKQAGAYATLVVSENKAALIKDDTTPLLEKIRNYLTDMDIVLAEGFKTFDIPKIEIFRNNSGHAQPVAADDRRLIAFVTDSDQTPKRDVPVFGLDDIQGIADLIETTYLAGKKA